MGYLNNSTITVDAILTKKGRELLAAGSSDFNITQFALGDDEVDYGLWNINHPLGSSYYGVLIENMPLVEAIPDETQALKYKLVTLPKQSTRIPVITVGNPSITLQSAGDTAVITPNTSNFASGNSTFGYTAILADNTIADISVVQPLANPGTLPTTPTLIGNSTDAQSVAVAGFAFQITAKNLLEDKTTTVSIIANETGGSTTVNVTVNKQTIASNVATSNVSF
jgi:hypothetical protein